MIVQNQTVGASRPALNSTAFAVCPCILQAAVPMLWPTPLSLYQYALARAVWQARVLPDPSLN